MCCSEFFDVARQIFHAQVANRNAEIVSGDVFQFVRLVENHRGRFRQDARVGRVFRLQLDGEVGKKQVMVDDNDVAFRCPAAHLGDEAALALAALLSDTRFRAGVELVPEQAGFGQFGQFGAVAGPVVFSHAAMARYCSISSRPLSTG